MIITFVNNLLRKVSQIKFSEKKYWLNINNYLTARHIAKEISLQHWPQEKRKFNVLSFDKLRGRVGILCLKVYTIWMIGDMG